MLKKYNFKKYVLEKNPESFFNWCLENQLYKVGKNTTFNSRMKKYYNGEISFNGLTVVLAFAQDLPIGIILCEHQDYFENGKIYATPKAGKKRKVEHEFEWGLQQLGMLSMFVREEHCGQGIATYMTQELEKLRLWTVAKDMRKWHLLTVPLFEAREGAYDIAKKTLQYSYPAENNPTNYLFPETLNKYTHGLIELRSGDPAPMYPLSAKKPFIKVNFKKKKITYGNEFSIEDLHEKIEDIPKNLNKKHFIKA